VNEIQTTRHSSRLRRNRVQGLLWCTALVGGCVHGSAQSFRNLDFEAAGSQTIPANAVWLSWSLAATGWQHAPGADTFFVYHNPPATNLTQAYSLVDSSSSQWKPLAGNFSLALSSGYYSLAQPNANWVPAEVSQSGVVPNDAVSFRLLAEGDFQVYINSTRIEMSNLGGNLFGGDVTSFAGQLVNLEIVSASTRLHDPVLIDNLSFSTQAVPEPSILAVLGLGLAAMFAGRGFRRPKA
jgi:hypothetical protein